MEIFAKAMFWWCAYEAMGRVWLLCSGRSPRKKEVSVSEDVSALLIWAAICLWAAYLLWGKA